MTRRFAFPVALAVALAVGASESAAQGRGRVRDLRKSAPAPTHENVKYGTRHERNVLDFWKAESAKPTAVVIWFHGGGFKTGDKKDIRRQMPDYINEHLKLGISFVSCNYPFLDDARYLEIMQHCARAVQFVRSKQREWNMDPRRIGVFGLSAGALISEWLAYHGDLGKRTSRDPVERFSSSVIVAGGLWQPLGTQELVLGHMRRGGPPLFLYTNRPPSDGIHHPKYAKLIKAQADRLRIPAVLYGGDRNDIPPPPEGETPLTAQLKFFCKYLRVAYPAKKKHAHSARGGGTGSRRVAAL